LNTERGLVDPENSEEQKNALPELEIPKDTTDDLKVK